MDMRTGSYESITTMGQSFCIGWPCVIVTSRGVALDQPLILPRLTSRKNCDARCTFCTAARMQHGGGSGMVGQPNRIGDRVDNLLQIERLPQKSERMTAICGWGINDGTHHDHWDCLIGW